jgi:hypothetical protein
MQAGTGFESFYNAGAGEGQIKLTRQKKGVTNPTNVQ